MTIPRKVGRPSTNARPALFRLAPEVDEALDFVVGAGRYPHRTAALSAIVLRERKRLSRSTDAFAGRVAQRARAYKAPTMTTARRLVKAGNDVRGYIEEICGTVDQGGVAQAKWTYSNSRITVEATTDAIDSLADRDTADIVDELDRSGLSDALDGTRSVNVHLTINSSGALQSKIRRPARKE